MTEKSSDSEPTSESPSPDTPKHTMTSHAITDQTFDSSHRRVHYNPESTTGQRNYRNLRIFFITILIEVNALLWTF